MRRANRKAGRRSQCDRDAERSVANRKGTRELSRERETRRSQRGFTNEIETRARRDETRSVREREGNWIEGKSEGTVLTGDKTQFSNLVHCEYIVGTWTMYLPNTHPVHHRYIQNFPSQFPGSFPGAANAQYIHSVPGCVIKMS